eukprot:m.240699 g.240699  ORF g.240699 m.240699 type:complete len:1616 (-) comp17441_c0_seq2:1534-6381(-)
MVGRQLVNRVQRILVCVWGLLAAASASTLLFETNDAADFDLDAGFEIDTAGNSNTKAILFSGVGYLNHDNQSDYFGFGDEAFYSCNRCRHDVVDGVQEPIQWTWTVNKLAGQTRLYVSMLVASLQLDDEGFDPDDLFSLTLDGNLVLKDGRQYVGDHQHLTMNNSLLGSTAQRFGKIMPVDQAAGNLTLQLTAVTTSARENLAFGSLKVYACTSSETDPVDCFTNVCNPGTRVLTEPTTSTDRTCQACAEGRASTAANQPSCVLCDSKDSTDTRMQCTRCFDVQTTKNDGCVCKAGYEPNTDPAIVCTQCLDGYAKSKGDDECTICSAGKQAKGDHSKCTDCPSGKFNNVAGADCVECSDGEYQNSAGENSCKSDCGANKYVTNDHTSCQDCGRGRLSNAKSQGVDSCYCDQGFSVDGDSCQECPANEYASRTNQAECDKCPAGKSTNGTTEARDESACGDCPAGSVSVAGGNCSQCATGKYQDQAGKGSCDDCTVCDRGVTEVSPCTSTTNRQCQDDTPPVITLVGGSPFQHEAGTEYTDPGFSAEDTADGNVTVTTNIDALALEAVQPAQDRTITYTAADKADNTATSTRLIQVRDTAAPIFTDPNLGTLLLVEAGNPFDLPAASDSLASDRFPANPFVTRTLIRGEEVVQFPTTTPLTGTYEYIARDTSGNTNRVIKVALVNDTQAPTFVLLGSAADTLVDGESYVEDGIGDVVDTLDDHFSDRDVAASLQTSASLNLNGASRVFQPSACAIDTAASFDPAPADIPHPFASVADSHVSGHAPSGSVYTITYTLNDQAGNRRSMQRSVTTLDNTAPQISLTGESNVGLEVNTGPVSRKLFGATAEDGVDGVLSQYICVEVKHFSPLEAGKNGDSFSVAGRNLTETGQLSIITSTGVPIGTLYRIVYTVSDGSGKTSTATQTVKVVDTTAPVLTLEGKGEVSVLFGTEYREPGVTAADNSGEVVTVVSTAATVDVYKSGQTVVDYSASDGNDNVGRATRQVLVTDNTRPADEFVVQLELESEQTVDPREVEQSLRQAMGTTDFVIVFEINSRRRATETGDVIEFGVRRNSDFDLLTADEVIDTLPETEALGTALGVPVASTRAANAPSKSSSNNLLIIIIVVVIVVILCILLLLWFLRSRKTRVKDSNQHAMSTINGASGPVDAIYADVDIDQAVGQTSTYANGEVAAQAPPSAAASNLYSTPGTEPVPWHDDIYADGPSQAVLDLYAVVDKPRAEGAESSTDYYASPAAAQAQAAPQVAATSMYDVVDDAQVPAAASSVYAAVDDGQNDPRVGYNGDLYDQPSTVKAEAPNDPRVGYNGDLYDQPSTVKAEVSDQPPPTSSIGQESEYADVDEPAVVRRDTDFGEGRNLERRATMPTPDDDVTIMPGFYDKISRKEAHGLLASKQPGTYLIRLSTRATGFVLSLVGPNAAVEHHVIRRNAERTYCINETPFPSSVVTASNVLDYLSRDQMGILKVPLGRPLGATTAEAKSVRNRRSQAYSFGASSESDWLHPSLSRGDAEAILAEQGGTDGLFLVRQRAGANSYALSMAYSNSITHHLLKKDESGAWLINDMPAPESCSTLSEVIAMLHRITGPKLPGLIQQGVPAAMPEAEA